MGRTALTNRLSGRSKMTSTSLKKSKSVTTASWQSKLMTSGKRVALLYRNSKFTDLTITFPGHEDTIQCHRWALAMSSPVFEAMLFGPLAEKENLSLPDDPPEVFKWLLEYVYCDNKHFPNVKMAVQVYHLANKYQMDPLACLCSEFLKIHLTANSFPEIYDTAVLFEDASLIKKCLQMMNVSSSDVLTSPHVGQLSRDSMRYLLQQKLNISSEVIVFSAVVLWGKAQLSKGTKNGDSLRQVTEELLAHVRFLTMTTDELAEHVVPAGILTPDETCAMLMSIKNVNNMKLPAMFSSNREKRLCFHERQIRKVKLEGNHPYYHPYAYCPKETIAKVVTVSHTIYLKAIVDHGDVFHDNLIVSITNVAGLEVGTTKVINGMIEFKKPVVLATDEEYTICTKEKNDSPVFINEYNEDDMKQYSGTDGIMTLQGEFLPIPESLSFYYWCFSN